MAGAFLSFQTYENMAKRFVNASQEAIMHNTSKITEGKLFFYSFRVQALYSKKAEPLHTSLFNKLYKNRLRIAEIYKARAS